MRLFCSAMLFAAFWPLLAQDTNLQFEVAVVKPTGDRSAPGLIVHLPGERGYRGVNMALFDYLRVAFQVRPEQISAPDWISTENFDLQGKADRTCTADELHTMLQQLLIERFHIRLHRASKDVSGYRLAVEPGGHKMRDHDPEDAQMFPIQAGPGGGTHDGKNVSMQYLAFFLSGELGQAVVDDTGLKGHYDFNAKVGHAGSNGGTAASSGAGWGPPLSEIMNSRIAGAGIPVFDALRKQLGLRLEKAKVPAPQIVIDHIEKLSEN